MNKFEYKLSIIIPCHNCFSTIKRLLDSIVNNDLKKKEYEIVIVDDCSIDNFLDIVKEYDNKANIHYFHTELNTVHCPGNTRQVGLENAKGEWIAFIDHDDYFEPNIFQKVFKTIKEKNLNTTLVTSFYGINNDTYKIEDVYEAGAGIMPWLHGKFYNHQMLIDANISFKKNLKTHEDFYFNNLVQNYLYMNNIPFIDSNIFTYNWVYDPKSTSHYHEGKLHFFDINFKDFVYSNSEPFFILPDEYYDYKKSFILNNFLLFYFDYQLDIYRLGDDCPKENILAIKQVKEKINKELKISDDEIIKEIYDNPEYYHNLKQESFKTLDIPYVESQSFKDFIKTLNEIGEEQ